MRSPLLQFSWNGLPAMFPGFDSPDRWLPLLQRHAELIERNREAVRTTAVSAEDQVRRNFAESLELWRIAIEARLPERVVDVGSGGGFPGLVIAAVAPGADVHLVEPLQKRARFLAMTAAELGLTNVTVHGLRAEEAGRGPLRDSAQVVTARAVAELRELLEYTAPLCAPGGVIALPKGSQLDAEILAAGTAMAALGCSLRGVVSMRPGVSQVIRVALIDKAAGTDARFPRRPGMPGKRPL